MDSDSILLLGRSGLSYWGNIHTRYWVTFVDILSEKDNYWIKVLVILVWVPPDCGNCCGQLVTPNIIQQILKYQPWVESLVPIFNKVSLDNMVLDMLGSILFPVPCIALAVICRHRKAISASDAIALTWFGHLCPFSIPLTLMLFDIWIQVSAFVDLIQDVINSSAVYLILCCTSYICLSKEPFPFW